MIWTVFITTASLCLLLLPGFLFNKLKITQGRALAKGVSDYILYVAQPAMLIAPYIRDFDVEILKNAGFTVLLSFICHGLFTVSAMLIIRRKRKILPEDSENAQSEIERIKNLGTVRIAAIFGNCGYMGIPLIKSILGDSAAIYATVFNIGFQLFLWTVGCYLATNDIKYISPKKILLNPATISIFIGLIIFFAPINHYVPSFIVKAITLLDSTVVPLSMFVVGYHMAENRFKGIFRGGRMWLSIALRQFLSPVLAFTVLLLFKVTGLFYSYEVAVVVLLCSAAPCATITSIFAEKFDLDRETAGRMVPISTILSMATMPLAALLLKLF
ncbi:MAG: AEC family transporter [Clostridia bacterium]|nr:AEC family transporter [Clostridia bacterium]